ncbi:unnamed protein product [Adineta steineri]|uniref:Bulb-type lectin domain-containing protein n=1 Tax=Adineta steineri TaxID=433720 RepID=A0A819JEV8_9BILA|nr:unnamed protein product [Adineta steineri]CAF3932703.1 unnamed protein product [Adineta steineri]
MNFSTKKHTLTISFHLQFSSNIFYIFLVLGLSFNQPKFSSTPIWNSNGITFANQSIVGEESCAIFVNTNNTIYVANQENNTIVIWHEESVNPTNIIFGNFTRSTSLFVTSNGDIYIDDGAENGRVQRWIAETGIFVKVMNINSSCYGLFVDINDTLYCSMYYHHQVVKRPSNDAVINSNHVAAGTGSGGSESNQLYYPTGIFVDVNLDLYVADSGNHRIQLFQSGESNGITVAGSQSLNPTISLHRPTGAILDAEKYLFVVDLGNARIVGSSLSGFRCLVGCYGWGSRSNQLNEPSSFSFDHSGNMFVIDTLNSRIQKFLLMKDSFVLSFNQPKFCSTATWNSNGITLANQSIVGQYPTVIFVNTNNTIYVVHRQNNTIVIWQEESATPTKIIHNNFTGSDSLFVTSNGDIYINDGYKNGQVQKWIAETSTFVTVMNVNSLCAGLFVDIYDTLYCSMRDHHQVVKRPLNDAVINSNLVAAGTGSGGSESNQLYYPTGIFVDVNLDLYVADYRNDRVQLFQSEKSNGITVAGHGSRPPIITLLRPSAIILDAEKYLFILDSSNSRIVGSGLNDFRCIVGCHGSGSQSNQLNFLFSFSFNRYGDIIVADFLNHRIQKFQLFKESCVNTSSVVQTVYASELTKKSSQYWRDCTSSKSYYEAIQVNAHRSGLYTFVSKSNMNTYGSIYKDYFNPSNPLGNRYSHDNNSCNQKEFRFTVALEISIIYILVVTTFTSDTVGEFSIFISGPNNVDLKNINYPTFTEKPPALFQQPNYSSELTTNSQTYSRDCQKLNYYYETIRMNVMKNGYYGLKSASSINTFGDIYKDDFNPMDPFENLLIQDYQSCADKDFTFIANLHTGTKYILVVTTLSPNITGNFSILTTGINTIILNRYGKYFILFVNH